MNFEHGLDETEPVIKDRPINPFRIPRSENAKKVVSEVIRQILELEERRELRKRKRREADQKTFEGIVTAVACDLIHRDITEPDGWVSLSLSKQLLGKKTRYASPIMSDTLPIILGRMADPELGFISMEKGYQGYREVWGPAQQTRIRADVKLLVLESDYKVELEDLKIGGTGEVIILKSAKKDYWDQGAWIEYKDTAKTDKYRQKINRINDWLTKADISFDPYYEKDRAIDDTDRTLRRYFNNGSFSQGGRLFGGFWQPISKKQRKGIQIDGQDCIVLDYGQMAIRTLYGLAGAQPTREDAYLLPGLEKHRGGCKKVFNAALFADKPLNRLPKGTRDLFPRRVGLPTIIAAIKELHPAIAKYLFTGIGYKLQFIESEIMVDVLLEMIDIGLVGLPIHDAVIVKKSAISPVREVMLRVFKQHTNVEAIIGDE